MQYLIIFFFFFNDTATTEIYTLSLHDALPISIDDATVLDQEVVGHVILRGQGFVNEGNSTPVRRALSSGGWQGGCGECSGLGGTNPAQCSDPYPVALRRA